MAPILLCWPSSKKNARLETVFPMMKLTTEKMTLCLKLAHTHLKLPLDSFCLSAASWRNSLRYAINETVKIPVFLVFIHALPHVNCFC